MDYSIDQFWKTRFKGLKRPQLECNLDGWDAEPASPPAFVEATLSLRPDDGDLSQSVWLIAVSGAVGKSTLARAICANTKAVYLDLSTATTVAGNYLAGGLFTTGLWQAWKQSESTLLVDALDEARLRVTQSSFEDFLADVASVAKNRSVPIVLLGRVGIIEEAWLILNEKSNLRPPIFDIELFQSDSAKKFVLSTIHQLAEITDSQKNNGTYPHLKKSLEAHLKKYEDATKSLVDHLVAETKTDGHQFAGYAPVLVAVATVIASESNPVKIGNAITAILEGKFLSRVTSEIMDREASKLNQQFAAKASGVGVEGLYESREQLARLASLVLQTGKPKLPVALPQNAVAAYEEAVQSLLPQHPFLDSKTQKPAGAVFGACILAAALTGDDKDLADAAQRFVNGGANTPNPFLLAFYEEALDGSPLIPAEHIGLLYASLAAVAGAGDTVRLIAEGEESLDVEMSLLRQDGKADVYEFSTAAGSELRFGRRIGGITVDAELVDVELGDGGQLELVAPIVLKARNLVLSCNELVVKPDHPKCNDQYIYLEAESAIVNSNLKLPTVRKGVSLQVAWPDANNYPWTPFVSKGREDSDLLMANAQRELRRLCISFRSHSKGRLARFKGKVEHFRMTKGDLGIALRERLVADNVLSLEGSMYFLDPNVLGQKVGISFQDLKMKHYSAESRSYLRQLLSDI